LFQKAIRLMQKSFYYHKKGAHIMNKKRMLHTEVGLSALPVLMETDLKNIISKIAILKENDKEVGFFYVDITNHIFTLETAPLLVSRFNFTHAMLNDFMNDPSKFIEYICTTQLLYSQNVDDLSIDVVNINDINLEELPSITDIYNTQSSSNQLRLKFDNSIEIKNAIKKAAKYLTTNDLFKTIKVVEMPLSESDNEIVEDIRPKLLAVVKNYMFEIDNERFFFVSDINDWYGRIKENQDEDTTQIILNAYEFFNSPNTKNSKSRIDATVAHLIWSQLWNRAFNHCLYKRIDGAFKGIHQDANSLTILPLSVIKSQTNQQSLPEMEVKKNDQNH